jgi:NAD+ synthase
MRELDYKELASNISNWIKEYVESANCRGVVLGLSGGIDSAATAALAVKALGKEKVVTLGLPIESLPQDLEDGKFVADHLGIKFLVCDLTATYKEYIKVLPSGMETNQLAMANIKPRLRMTMIYFVGQSLGGYLAIGTGNRTEIAIGYFTKYGDGGVDFEPLGALYKCEVREVARISGIPERIVTRPPSAGLWEGQTDEGEIGLTYDVLDETLYRLDHNLDLEGLNQKDIEKIKKMMKAAEHKNKTPPLYEID